MFCARACQPWLRPYDRSTVRPQLPVVDVNVQVSRFSKFCTTSVQILWILDAADIYLYLTWFGNNIFNLFLEIFQHLSPLFAAALRWGCIRLMKQRIRDFRCLPAFISEIKTWQRVFAIVECREVFSWLNASLLEESVHNLTVYIEFCRVAHCHICVYDVASWAGPNFPNSVNLKWRTKNQNSHCNSQIALFDHLSSRGLQFWWWAIVGNN